MQALCYAAASSVGVLNTYVRNIFSSPFLKLFLPAIIVELHTDAVFDCTNDYDPTIQRCSGIWDTISIHPTQQITRDARLYSCNERTTRCTHETFKVAH